MLTELREKAISKGMKLLSDDQVLAKIRHRRAGTGGKMELTLNQLKVLERLNDVECLYWKDTHPHETRTLTRLCKAGMAGYQNGRWVITQQGREESEKYKKWKEWLLGNY
jgi:hypothetical protein